MENQAKEFEGKSVQEAIIRGLTAFGLSEEDVVIEIVRQPSKGLFGIGAVDALVRLTPKAAATSGAPSEPVTAGTEPAPANAEAEEPVPPETDERPLYSPELVTLAVSALQNMLTKLGIEAGVDTYVDHGIDIDPQNPPLVLDIQGDDLGILIGRQSETLRSLEYLVRLIVNQRVKHWVNISVDVNAYRKHRRESLQKLALRLAKQVVENGQPIKMEAMPAAERRIVHLTLRDFPGAYTESMGERSRRRVIIYPQKE